MSFENLSLTNLNLLDYGKCNAAFQRLLKQAVQDCDDRPALKKKRKITLTLELEPVMSISGNTIDCESVKGSFQLKISLPNMQTDTIDFGIRNNGDLYFNPDAPENHNQHSMDEVDGYEIGNVHAKPIKATPDMHDGKAAAVKD